MRALVVYESMFGNTRTIAEAIGDGLAGAGYDVAVLEVGDAPGAPDPDVDLLVVGGPTHAFGLSHASTRTSAAEQSSAPVVSDRVGLRDWLEALPRGRGDAAAFDTHIDKHVPGSAARGADRRLRRRGYHSRVAPESFLVTDVQGPLVDGEVARAGRWAERVAAARPVRA